VPPNGGFFELSPVESAKSPQSRCEAIVVSPSGQGLAAGPLLGEKEGGSDSGAGILTDTHTGKGGHRWRARDHSLHRHAAVDKLSRPAQGSAAQRKSIHPV